MKSLLETENVEGGPEIRNDALRSDMIYIRRDHVPFPLCGPYSADVTISDAKFQTINVVYIEGSVDKIPPYVWRL